MLNEQGYITHTHGNIQIATSEIQGHYHAIQDTPTHLVKKSFNLDKNNELGRQNLHLQWVEILSECLFLRLNEN